jgi:prolipoprotein diacylglyceryl transferase
MTLLASIPSPAHNTVNVGPVTIHFYGLMLLAAIAACVWLTGVRYVHRGGNWDLIFQAAVWGVIAGVIGARLYHDATSWNEVQQIHHWWAPFAVWKGGLGIYGGILFGVAVGAFVVHRAGESIPKMMDLVAPGLLLAQAIGRWGNWFNQELFGKPTSLPWGLKISAANVPPGYAGHTTFQPTFLYESLLALVGVGLLLVVERRFKLRSPALFSLYIAYYALVRFFMELLRIDPTHHFAGLRLNAWVSIFVFACAWGFFVWWQFIRTSAVPALEGAVATAAPVPAAPSGTKRLPGEKKGLFKRMRKAKEPSVKVKGPRMSVPKGRVRPGR